jgi:glycosyltransferase involved in cell wall biosynthesis
MMMRIAIIGKFPPIQGGVSRLTYQTAHELARRGCDVLVLTNADQTEYAYRQMFMDDDAERLAMTYAGGGSVTVFNTDPVIQYAYIPWAQPFATELYGLGLDVLDSEVDLIVGWYFEPYGITAAHLAREFGIPLVLIHAGSDISRLARHPNLRAAYTHAASRAGRILTMPVAKSLLEKLQVKEELCQTPLTSQIPTEFFRRGQAMDLPSIVNRAEDWFARMSLSNRAQSTLQQGMKLGRQLKDRVPIIGTYNKVSASKGSYDMLPVLEALAEESYDFYLCTLSGSKPAEFECYLEALGSYPRLSRRTVTLPFVAPWRVPEFLTMCDYVLFLERDFDVPIHSSGIPREVLASGAVLVCSGQAADHGQYESILTAGTNYIRVPDPKDHAAFKVVLRQALEQQVSAERIGEKGRIAAARMNAGAVEDGFADAIMTAIENLQA